MNTKPWSTLLPRFLAVFLLVPAFLSAEPLPLKRAVELALSHGTAAGVAEADQKRFLAQYLEARNQYIPQLTAGAGLGWSDGFPQPGRLRTLAVQRERTVRPY